jgi:UDP-N-acetylmuramoylalanine--D-glutamate ligase
MMDFDVRGKRVTVVGGALSGIAAAELLAARGALVTLSDMRPSLPDLERLRSRGIAIELGEHRAESFQGADLLVLSPGVSLVQPALAAARLAGVPAIGEVELAFRWLPGRVIAITGTKGKSTTTTLVGRMLAAGGMRVQVAGNIGNPISAYVQVATPDTVFVVEVSSFQLETTDTFRPWIAVLLNFSPDHLDRHASLAEYAAAKQRIFANQTPEDWAVVNADDPPAIDLASIARSRVRLFSTSGQLPEGVTIRDDHVVSVRDGRESQLLPLSAVRLFGRHLLADVVAAAAVAELAGVPAQAMTTAVSTFTGLEHAMELVGEVDGVRFVNDSKATNVDSARHSIESFDRDVVAIMGGRYKGGDLRLLREPLAKRARLVVAIGESRHLFAEALDGAVAVREAASLKQAVRTAFEAVRPDGIVVLAPACSSFDMFENYAARGRAFKREVQELAGEIGGGKKGA